MAITKYKPIRAIGIYIANHSKSIGDYISDHAESIKRGAKTGACVSLAALVIYLSAGCEQKNPNNPENPKDKTKQTTGEDQYVYGTVIYRFGTMVNYQKALETALTDSNGIIPGNEKFEFGPLTYGIGVKAEHDGKIYTVGIRLSEWKKLEAFARASVEESRVRIERSPFYQHLDGLVTIVPDDKIGVE